MGKVKNALVIGIGVNGGHQTAFDTKFFHQYFSERSQAVGGARSVGNDVVFFRIILIFIYTHNDGDVFLFSRSRDNNFFSTSFDVSSSFRTFGETTGRFNNDFYTQFTPRQFSRVSLSQYFNFFAINNDVIAINSYFVGESAMYRVIFQKMRQSFSVSQVIYSYDFNFRIGERYTENLATNSTKTINTYFCHNKILLKYIKI